MESMRGSASSTARKERDRIEEEIPDLDTAVERACARIAPSWPLDQFIATNPLWGFIDAPLPTVAARLASLSGARMVMPRAFFQEERRSGRLRTEHLREAIAQAGSHHSLHLLETLLEGEEPARIRRALVTDVVDTTRDLVHEVPWRDFVTNGISQFCAAYFDDGQAQAGPSREGGLYASWRRDAIEDRSPSLLMGLTSYRALARQLPEGRRAVIEGALAALDIAPSERENYLTALLLSVNGWAAWCAYRRWTAKLRGGDDDHILDLLAVRLAWEWLLYDAGGPKLRSQWQVAMARWRSDDHHAEESQSTDWLYQKALEIAYQETLCRDLARRPRAEPPPRAAVQAVFCIDVRSEVFRRALEAESPEIQTLGFAGFFGLPIEYEATAGAARVQLPGLLAPRMRATDTGVPASLADRRASRIDLDKSWKAFRTSAVSSFSFVEALGLFYAGKLIGDSLGRRRPAMAPERAGLTPSEDAARKPRLTATAGGGELTLAAKVELAAGILRAMSLTHGFARLVLLAGHGSETVNNPHAAGLDCGACCGQTGEVNARAAAALLNEADVREGLAARGIDVPLSTRFVPGLHNTTTDAVTLFDLDELAETHRADVARLEHWLAAAGGRARAERAASLGLAHLGSEDLRKAVVSRASDWSQVRPEWGLTNNAAFIIAPRELTRHIDLRGRSFLHDYRWQEDADFSVLELLMTAPMVVTHWINFQYYASTVDNQRYGSGNKVLHNVVGGHLGVFEGSGGDLRIGLPLQSLHDGARWVHTPLRLSVFIEAPRSAIERIVQKHALVRQLVEHEWLFLFQVDSERRTTHAYRRQGWVRSFTDC